MAPPLTEMGKQPLFQYLTICPKALCQIGIRQVSAYAWYKLALCSGYLFLKTRKYVPNLPESLALNESLIQLPNQDYVKELIGKDGITLLLKEADEIVNGQVRLFGGPAVPLKLVPDQPIYHWTVYESGTSTTQIQDIKYVWEPGRFGWAFTLGRAYYLTGQEEYARAFWELTQSFANGNPPYWGPHWASGQEVSLRILAFAFASAVFSSSVHTTSSRKKLLATSLVTHANRIPMTLAYAKAQNNNHLISEAVGLYTAGSILVKHPQAVRWKRLGWKWLNYAFQNQIAEDGTYIQHSTNYHRLMLQAALWTAMIASRQDDILPPKTLQRLSAATHWLTELVEPKSGKTINLGANDGAYILPFSTLPFDDFRPVVQAASKIFNHIDTFPAGPWREMEAWLGDTKPTVDQTTPSKIKTDANTPLVLRCPRNNSWAYLRAAHFTSRPGHADQLHLDLWWRDLNLAQDAGTYYYNASPPWDNALTHTAIHNTLMVNDQEQMTRVNRFLYLDWAQAQIYSSKYDSAGNLCQVTVQHNGYRTMGIIHQRSVEVADGNWLIIDLLQAIQRYHSYPLKVRLHWLLPDWSWEFEESTNDTRLGLKTPYGMLLLDILVTQPTTGYAVEIIRAGKLLYSSRPDQSVDKFITWGWTSPIYGTKIPALSFAIRCEGSTPLEIKSWWKLPA